VDDAGLEARRHRTHEAFLRCFGAIEREGGIVASVTPAAPGRSLFNAVTYEDPDALIAARDELAAVYRAAGVHAWTVWVAPRDRDLAAALQDAGHRLDGTPEAMGCVLDDLDLDGDDLGTEPSWEDFVAVNAAAYGVDASELAPLASIPAGGLRRYGVPRLAVVGTLDRDGDCGVTMVATHPRAQRRGLCSALMRQALRAARARGCTTATLEATRAGRPLYERLGFRPLGRLEMWEHRTAPAS
jgi:ribosomal protein S18 acetylase RimI-like enzyme